MAPVLQSIVVLETAEWVAGPYCGKLLADYGATVVKIEPPTGDPSRSAGPYPGDQPSLDSSGLFLHLNTGKQSVVLDLSVDTDRDAFLRLASTANVIIDDGRLGRVGIEYEELRRQNPELVWVDISGFGRNGPYRDYRMNDYAAYAASAWMAAMGDPDKPPVFPGKDYPFYVAGLYAVFGTITALIEAHRSGAGQRVDLSVLDAAISIDLYESSTISYGGSVRQRNGTRVHGVAASLQPCKDGWIALTVNANAAWQGFCDVIGAPELAQGKFDTPAARMQRADELEAEVRARLATMTMAEVVDGCQARRIAVSPVVTTKDIYESAQLRDREWFVEVEHSPSLRVEHTGPAFRLYGTPARVGRAPKLGEHTDTVFDVVSQESS